MSVDVSICVVNFNTAPFIGPLLETLHAQNLKIDGRDGTFELILVDNASRGEDTEQLRELVEVDDQVRLVQNTQNCGYAQANNQGFHVARGRYHMILNPDTRLLDGCLQVLVDHLEQHADTAMVGPKSFMDLDCTFVMPPNQVPTPELYESQTDGQTDAVAGLAQLNARTRFTYPYWTATEPFAMDFLSGSCLFFRHDLFSAEDPPFDPGFPLYYEDTDLCVRMGARGLKMVHLPDAGIIHFFSRAAYTHAKGAEYRARLGEERFYRKYYGEEGLARFKTSREKALAVKESGNPTEPFPFEPMEAGAAAPEFFVDDHKDYYIEISGNPIFTLAAAMFPEEDGYFAVSHSMWKELGPATYWLRLVSKSTLESLQGWAVTKTCAS